MTDTGKDAPRLEFKQRLSVGIGAAKGIFFALAEKKTISADIIQAIKKAYGN